MILNNINIKESVCSCNKCVNMCKTRPCWGTPEEIEKIISKGFDKQLMVDYWSRRDGDILILCGAIKGYEKRNAPSWPDGECSFLTKDDKCILHDLKLKPLEGRAAICDGTGAKNLHEKVAKLWDSNSAQELVSNYIKKFKLNE